MYLYAFTGLFLSAALCALKSKDSRPVGITKKDFNEHFSMNSATLEAYGVSNLEATTAFGEKLGHVILQEVPFLAVHQKWKPIFADHGSSKERPVKHVRITTQSGFNMVFHVKDVHGGGTSGQENLLMMPHEYMGMIFDSGFDRKKDWISCELVCPESGYTRVGMWEGTLTDLEVNGLPALVVPPRLLEYVGQVAVLDFVRGSHNPIPVKIVECHTKNNNDFYLDSKTFNRLKLGDDELASVQLQVEMSEQLHKGAHCSFDEDRVPSKYHYGKINSGSEDNYQGGRHRMTGDSKLRLQKKYSSDYEYAEKEEDLKMGHNAENHGNAYQMGPNLTKKGYTDFSESQQHYVTKKY